MSPSLVAPSPASKLVVFRSIDRPEVGLMGPKDVELCEDCGDLTADEYREAVDRHGHQCLTCRGWRIVSGYGPGGHGYPVEVVS
jgi:hypothetical protein